MSKGFGISNPGTNQQTRTSTVSVEYDELLTNEGEIQEMTTVKKAMETTEDFFVPATESVTDPAIPGQIGTKVVTGYTVTEEAGKYARYSVTTRHGGEAVGVNITGGSVSVTGGTVSA